MPSDGIIVKKGGQKKFVRQSELDAAIADGWSAAEDVATDILGTGRASLVSADAFTDVEDFSATGGRGELVSQEEKESEVKQRFIEEEYDTLGNEVLAAGSGVASGLTLGASDLAISALGGQEQLQNITETNPFARGAGEVAGVVAGSALSGGASIGRFLPSALAARAATAAGRGAKVLARGSKVAGLAAEGAVDGALFGAGQAVAQAAISDKPISAENIIGSMSSEALYGGALGGALGVAVGGLGKLSRRIDARKVAKTAGQGDIAKAQKAYDDASDALAKATNARQRATAQRALDSASAKHAIAASKQADDAVTGLSRFAEDVTGTPKAIELEPAAFNAELDRIGKLELANPAGGNKSAIKYSRVKNAPTLEPEQFKLLADNYGIKIPDTPGAQALAQAYVARRTIDEVAAQSLKAGKQAAAEASTKKALEATDAAQQATMLSKLGRTELGQAKRAGGGEVGRLPGPLQSVLGGRLGGMYRAVTSGPRTVKTAAERFIKSAGKPRKGTVAAASTILSKIKFDPELGEKPAKTRAGNVKRIGRELQSIASNPEKAKQRIQQSLGEVNSLKPALAAQLADKAFQRMMLLHSVVPRNPRVSAFGPSSWTPNNTEVDKFAKIAAAAEDPYSILDDLERGGLTQESVDTVKQLYPEIYHEMQMELVNRAEEIKEKVGYTGRLQLGILFQAPTDEVLQPEFIRSMQANYAIRAQEQEQLGGTDQYSTPGSNQQAVASTATTSQRLEVAK